MSLLNRGNEVVTVYPEEVTTSPDGNVKVRASAVGIVSRAVVQFISSSDLVREGLAADATESHYRLRLVGWQGGLLGSKSQIEWQGKRYALDGEPRQYRGSARTAHVDYVMVRS